MKNIKKILASFLFLVLIIGFSINTNATESNTDGLEISLSTNQEEYKEAEKISLDLSIKNTNQYSVILTNVKNSIPEGFKISNTIADEISNYELNAGEIIHVKTELSEEVHDSAELSHAASNVNTGDNSKIDNLLIIVCVGGTILVLIKYKSSRKAAMFLIVLGITMTSSLTIIQAREESNVVYIEKEVLYDGEIVKVECSISYNYNFPDPKNPVEYQDGLTESKLDYKLNEEQKKITLSNNEELKKWKKGEIHILKSISNPIDDIAIIVETIESMNDGSLVITYSTPDISNVIKSIDYEGTSTHEGTIIPADGVSFSDANTKEGKDRSISPGVFSADIEESGSMKLFGNKVFNYNCEYPSDNPKQKQDLFGLNKHLLNV